MLKRLVCITAVTKWNATAGANFQRSTLIYGDNGRGKTSLAATLRSLAANDPHHILERTAIGATAAPHIQLLFDVAGKNVMHEFKSGAWTSSYPNIEIFDTRFVSDNVYSGDVIDPEQRRQLYHFVLGAANVSLAERVDELDVATREANAECSALQEEIERAAGQRLNIEDFLKLPALPDAAAAIQVQEARVRAAEQSGAIISTPAFTEVVVPSVDVLAIRARMARSLDDISALAEAHVRGHLDRLGDSAREWVEQGMHYLGETSDCPFCGLDVAASTLIADYRIAFSEVYALDTEANATEATRFDDAMSPQAQRACDVVQTTNSSTSPFWSGHRIDVSVVSAPIPIDDWSRIRDVVNALFESRRQSLLAPIPIDGEAEEYLGRIAVLAATLSAYNKGVAAANEQIASLKLSTATVNLTEERDKLTRVRLQSTRRLSGIEALCARLEVARLKKRTAEKEKEVAKKALDAASSTLFTKYQARINKHLANSACGYSIVGAKTSFAGGKPRTEYQLEINGRSIDLIAPKGSTDAPCFRNTLSDGDRSALALAFFLARLDLDPALSSKIVIIDDPMASLDAHRRAYTCEQVALLSTRALQVIVLTHDSMFAADVWRRFATPRVALRIAVNGSHSEIIDWDVEEDTASEYFKRCATLLRCMNGTKGVDLTAAAGSIRPVLEGNLRMRFPADLPTGKWLGELIEAIRDAPVGSNLEGAKKHLAELIALNTYSKRYHHDGTPGVVIPVPPLAELQAYCRRTLEFIQGV